MCYFIAAICSADTKLTKINSVGEAFDLKFADCKNEHISKQISKTEKYLLKSSKICECGTSLGKSSSKNNKTKRVQKSEIDKLKKRCWTQTKITRYLTDKKKNEDKQAKQNEEKSNKANNELENYINFIQEIFKKTDAEIFGLLLHWYSYGVEDENIKLTERKIISCKNLTVSDLKTLEEDLLLCVRK